MGEAADSGTVVGQAKSGESRYIAESLLKAIGNTGICVFLYYPEQKYIEVPKNTCEKYGCRAEYDNMPTSFADDFVHDDDRETFFELYRKIDEGAGCATASFHSRDMSACCRVTLTELGGALDNIREVMGVIEDVSESDRNKTLIGLIQDSIGEVNPEDIEMIGARSMAASAIGEQYYGLYCINLLTGRYVCYLEQIPGLAATSGGKGLFASSIAACMDYVVHPDDRDGFRDFVDISKLADILGDRRSISFEYRRNGVGWTRGHFIVAKRDESGQVTDVVFAAEDINAERTSELARRKAVYEAQHDQLTGAFNRKAFDEMMASGAYDGSPVGFAIMDIDHFKEVNDEYGHEVGDTVIANVAKTVSSMFRDGDMLYRIGGDEFVVLLPDATESSWKAICGKLEKVHAGLSDILSSGEDLTLSVGICFSSSGVGEWMYPIADKALFNTKRNGRAGCTLVREDGTVLGSWRDGEASVKTKSALDSIGSGTVRIEVPADRSERPRFFCGESLRRVYGMSSDMTSEERFDYWLAGVDDEYRDMLERACTEMFGSGNVECSFLWAQPGGGEPFMVRSVGSGCREDGVDTIYGVHRSLKGARIIEKPDDADFIIAAHAGVYVSSYYIDIVADAILTLKQTDCAAAVAKDGLGAQGALAALNANLIDASYHKAISEFFDLKTLPERMGSENSIDCDFLSITEQGWCRASWIPVKRGADGLVTHALFVVSSMDATQQARMAEDQMTAELMGLHYEAAESILDSKILAMALFDRETGEGRSWTCATGFSKPIDVNFAELRRRDDEFAPTSMRDELSAKLGLEQVVSRVSEDGSYSVQASYETDAGQVRHLIYRFSSYAHDDRLIMAIVEDATKRVEAERGFALTSKSLEAALMVSSQTIWELDFSTRVATCYTDENVLGLPKRIEGCPESLAGIGLFCPGEYQVFEAAVEQVEDGSDEAHCDVKVCIDGNERWHSCSVYARRDLALGRRFATLFVTDISLRVAAVHAFEERMESLLNSDPDVIKGGVYNLSKDEVLEVHALNRVLPGAACDHSIEKTLEVASQGILDEGDRRRYVQMFSRENLLALAESGERRPSMECLYEVEPGRTEWIEASAEFAVNPINGDIEVVGRIRSISELRFSGMLIRESLRGTANALSILLGWGDEYYLFDGMMKAQCAHKLDYWGDLCKSLDLVCDESERERVFPLIEKEKVVPSLMAGHDIKTTFLANFEERHLRMELSFSVVDLARGIVFANMRDITDEEIIAKLQHDARHDSLTGLYNRQATFAKCQELLQAHPDQEFIMVKMDVRRFRMFNSFFGEKVGDDLLRNIADNLRGIAGDYPFSAYGRIESDVFCGFYPKDDALFARHIRMVKERFAAYRDDFRLDPSIGIYVVGDRSLPVEGMFSRASSAAKEGGTKIYEFAWRHNDELERKLERETIIANEMQSALEQEQFAIYLQPKFDLRTGRQSGAEALVRWLHPTRGMVSPGDFIPLFERNGFISTLDQYMWEHVCALLRKWIDEGRDVKPISVNVSRVSACSPTADQFLLDLVQRYDIRPSLLELELTESAYIDDPEEVLQRMQRLQEAGFKILMDDFGSGYSSLNTLRNLPVDVLKLDIGFIAGCDEIGRGRTVISSILDMTERLDLPVIAEGVETQSQADFLKAAGCEFAQGYLFARPMPVSEFEKLA